MTRSHRAASIRWLGWAAFAAAPALAQDAVQGAQNYLQLPSGVPSCVTCHGPDASQNRNNLLRASDNPQALVRALNTVSAMGYLRFELNQGQIDDLAAYLGRVRALADMSSPLAMWPLTLDIGVLSAAGVSPEHHVRLQNRRAFALTLDTPRLSGGAYTLVHDCPSALPSAGACTLSLRATAPSQAGGMAGAVVVATPEGFSTVLGIKGSVRAEGVPGLAPVAPGSRIDFADVAVGAARGIEWPLSSTGTLPVTLGVPVLSGPQAAQFSIEGDCMTGRVLAPGQGCTVRAVYRPGAATPAAATLQMRSDGTNPGTLALAGQGIEAPQAVAMPAAPSTGGGASRPLHLLLLLLAVGVLRACGTRR